MQTALNAPGMQAHDQASQSVLENGLDGEPNVGSIRAMDKELASDEASIKFKRTRNSLLNIHILPPEILGKIFHWNVMLRGDFGGLEKGSHNFLFICHHWFEVALRTPEIWSFWGDTPRDWARCHTRSATAPLDLVLSGVNDDGDCLNPTLINVLQDRTSRDTIRRVHLRSGNPQLLRSILSSLTPQCENMRPSQMQSFILWNWEVTPVDVSDFVTHRYFPELQRLDLTRCTISSWDLLRSRSGALTELHLNFVNPTPTPTTLQLLSILASNPHLQEVALLHQAVPDDHTDAPFRVPLHHLRQLLLSGDLRHVFGLLQQLEHPATLDRLGITLYNCTEADVPQVIGPYLRSHLQRRGRSPSGLGLSLSCDRRIVFNVGEGGGNHSEAAQMDSVVELSVRLGQSPPKDLLGKTAMDLIAFVPPEDIVDFWGNNEPVDMGDIYTRLPNLKTLFLNRIHLPAVFPGPNFGEQGSIPSSVKTLTLQRLMVGNNDWSSLTTFLALRASSGERLDILKILHFNHMCREVRESIEGMVHEFAAVNMHNSRCPSCEL
ncbi:hypothetical protein BJ322DRAFT_452898 [Thelephora terrestris]|uniref:F-box domain-containing protein n=1 Tax=Thelephora terrestris TaxID=56493 RepID=A0A9P6H4F6_9AGAM|nr:hypothetical protein BJ322DRAFT_452898 [Thelephora terrestris]